MFCSMNKRKRKISIVSVCVGKFQLLSPCSYTTYAQKAPGTNTMGNSFLVSQPYDVSNIVNCCRENQSFIHFSPHKRVFIFHSRLHLYELYHHRMLREFSIASEKIMLEILKINQRWTGIDVKVKDSIQSPIIFHCLMFAFSVLTKKNLRKHNRNFNKNLNRWCTEMKTTCTS